MKNKIKISGAHIGTILIVVAILLGVSKCHAQTIVQNFQKISATDTLTHEIEFNIALGVNPYPQMAYIMVDSANTGTIQFAVALTGTRYPIRSTMKTYKKGARIPITFRNGLYNLFYKASASGNAFTPTN